MARVAGELGSSPMSLYRYVAAKDELLALMVDAALGPVPPPAPTRTGAPASRAGRGATTTRCGRHPWALQVPISGPAVTPNLTAWLEDGLQSLAATGLPEAQKLSVMLLLSGYVRNEATLAAASAPQGGEIMPAWGRLLARLTDPEDFPALHRALGSEAFAQDDEPDDEFVFGLERVLDGIGSLVSGKD